MAGHTFTTATAAAGTWTLSLTSASLIPGVVANGCTAHGSLTAKLPDPKGNLADLNLSF